MAEHRGGKEIWRNGNGEEVWAEGPAYTDAGTGLGASMPAGKLDSTPWQPSKALERGSNNHGSFEMVFKQFHGKSYSSPRRALCRKEIPLLPPPKRASWLWKQFPPEDSDIIMSAIQPKCHRM